MQQKLLLFFSTIILLLGASPRDSDDILCWSENKLTFDDFKGVYDDSVRNEYPDVLGLIEKTILVDPRESGDTNIYVISACMKRNISWIKTKGDTASLIHEQGHFDICEIYARVLRRDIVRTKSKEEAKALWKQTTRNEELEHDCFDSENSHNTGGVKPGWQLYIKNRLMELDNYKSTTVKVVY